jgi:non-specific serine/threonine protein kinase
VTGARANGGRDWADNLGMSLAAGSRLGPYEIVAPVGAGGMGEVYRARDARLGREVAVKVLPAALADEPERLRRFATEARAAAAVSHPNVLAVYDVETGDTPYLVFELLEGETLRASLSDGPLPPGRAVEIAAQVARGLAAAHDRGIVHRDLKPDNVFLTRDGQVKILDFGLARVLEPPSGPELTAAPTLDRTAAGTILGTSGYMSPEQVRGLPAEPRSDLFALGILLYEMLTGQRAFARPSLAESSAAILRDDPPAPGRPLPPGLDRVVRRCLAKTPGERFPSARELVFTLEAMGRGSDVSAGPAPVAPSVAVLPFADLSPARDQEYFCDGLAEELIAALGRLGGVRVASRTSSFQFRGSGTDVRAIGERLGVGAVLEGSVRRAGERLRVDVRLVGAADGYPLWSERFDRRMEDVFAIQEEIAESVARALRVVLSDRDRDALQSRRSSSPEAYELYLQARRLVGGLRDLPLALPLLDRALELDPGFALAHAGMAEVSHWLYAWFGSRPEDLQRAEESSRRALEIAPELAETHVARAATLALTRRFDDAAAEFEAAIERNPQLWEAYWLYGRMRFAQGHSTEAERLWKKAMEVRPEDYQVPLLISMIYATTGRRGEMEAAQLKGIELARRQLERDPGDLRAMYLCAGGLVQRGRTEEGLRLLARVLSLARGDPSVLYNAACVYAQAGEREKAITTLQECVRVGWYNRDWMAHDADLESIRDDPRVRAMIEPPVPDNRG